MAYFVCMYISNTTKLFRRKVIVNIYILNKNLTTQNRHVGLSKTVLTSKIGLHVPTQHTGMFGT